MNNNLRYLNGLIFGMCGEYLTGSKYQFTQ
jgi:hypothetical protein